MVRRTVAMVSSPHCFSCTYSTIFYLKLLCMMLPFQPPKHGMNGSTSGNKLFLPFCYHSARDGRIRQYKRENVSQRFPALISGCWYMNSRLWTLKRQMNESITQNKQHACHDSWVCCFFITRLHLQVNYLPCRNLLLHYYNNSGSSGYWCCTAIFLYNCMCIFFSICDTCKTLFEWI